MNQPNISSYNHSVCIDLNDWEWGIHYQFRWWLEGIGILLVGTIGVIFNMVAIALLQTKDLAVNRFNNLVVCLAIADNVFLLTSIFSHVGHAFGFQIQQSYIHQKMYISLVYPWRAISMCCSTYITVALALDRYHAVSNPSKYRASLRSFTHPIVNILQCTLPILFISILFNVPRFFDLTIREYLDINGRNLTNETILRSYFIDETPLRINQTYIFLYVNVANFLVTGLIPLSLLAYLNGQLILKRKSFIERQIQRRKRSFYKRYNIVTLRNHRQQTIILHTIVIVFLLGHALRIVLNIDEWIYTEDSIRARDLGCPNRRFWTSLATPVSHLLLQINSGANFFIYSVLNETFSKMLKEKTINLLVELKLKTKIPGPGRLRKSVSEPAISYRKRNKTDASNLNGIVVENCEILQ